jgi:16S rRNA (guanine527-N7)-methyltransferase
VLVSRETQASIDRFVGLLLRWNRTVNLISRATEANVYQRHVADSLQLAPLISPLPARAIDLGSGAGFPGLVLSLATGVTFELVEADQRKAAFLREAARITEAPVTIRNTRVESARLPPARLITSRALAPLPDLLRLAFPLLTPDGVCLFPKGAGIEDELTAAGSQWQMRVERLPSQTEPSATILRISEIAPRVATIL